MKLTVVAGAGMKEPPPGGKGYDRKWSWLNGRYCHTVCQKNLFPGRDSSPGQLRAGPGFFLFTCWTTFIVYIKISNA
jgi:hypothetical protein